MKRGMAVLIASALVIQFGCAGGHDNTSASDDGTGPFASQAYALVNNGGIVSVTASAAQPAYPASSAVDGNFATRWSTQGSGQWITADLGAVQSVQGLQVAWYRGSFRQYYFSIGVSADGSNFTTVYDGTSSGTTLQFESYSFAAASARYLKLTVNGNSQNDWDSVTELAVTLAPGATPAATPVLVAVTPQTAAVSTGGTAQFTASITGSTNTAVTWSVQEGAAGGTIDATGLYTAPATAGTYHVVTTSQADATQSSTATVTVTAPATTTTTPTVVAVAVAPTTAAASTGGTAQFSATVTGSTNTAVSWSVQEGSAGGAVTSTGLYTAPSAAGTYHVVATSAAAPTQSGSATVTVSAPATTSTTTTTAPTNGIVPAFLGAQGGGALSVGGRGGSVIPVTNLNDSGTGSLRACMQATGARTCVFQVSGVITLSSPIYLGSANSYLTVAGQTAPGGGIAIAGGSGTSAGTIGLPTSSGGANNMIVVDGAHDVTMRFVRLWRGYNQYAISSSMECGVNVTVYQGHNLILDHVTAVWGMDKSISLWPNSTGDVTNVTLSYSIVGEGVGSPSCFDTGILTGSDSQSAADTMTDIDLHHNYVANANHRFPLFKSKSGRIVNNVFFNWLSWASGVGGGASADFVGNYWFQGPAFQYGASIPRPLTINKFDANPTCTSCGSAGTPSVYVANNVGPGQTSVGSNDWDNLVAYSEYEGASQCGYPGVLCSSTTASAYHPIWIPDGRPLTPANSGAVLQNPGSLDWKRSSPLLAATSPAGTGLPPTQSNNGVAITPLILTGNGQNLLDAMLPDTAANPVGSSERLDCNGNWVLNRDASDERMVSYVLSNPSAALVDQSYVSNYNPGGFPVIAAGTACTDTDGDGIPDAYETAHGLNPNDPTDGPIIQSDGFSNLEHYLNGN